MKTGLRPVFAASLALLLSCGAGDTFARAGRLIALYLGPTTFGNSNSTFKVGIPDSVAYTYSGSRTTYDLATTYELDTVNHTSSIIGYEYYAYRPDDSLLSYTSQTVTGGLAVNSTRTSYAYDGAGNDTLILGESWNTATSAWAPSFRNIYSYNAARQRTGVLWQSWNTATGAWANLTRFAYQYDAAGRDSARVQQKWVAATGSWKNVTRNQTRYTTFNKIDSLSSQRWSDTTAVWKDSTATINHYNSSNYLVSIVHGPFYNPNSSNIFDSVAYTALNAAGSPLVAIGYLGNPSGNTISWLPDLRFTYTYNSANQQLSNQLEMIDKNYVGFNSLTGISEYNSAGQLTTDERVNLGTGYNLYKTLYKRYYESTTAVPNSSGFAAGGVTVMPSPATGLVSVSIGANVNGNIQGALVDATGKIALQWSEPAGTNRSWQFSVAEFPAGVYFVRLSGNGFSGSKMLVVQH